MIVVTWYRAAAYCNWLSRNENLPECYEPNDQGKFAEGMKIKADALKLPGYRLPTEAEWEYACRAGAVTGRSYGRSTELLGKYAWYLENSNNRAWPCGRLQPNDLGLFDMLGNVYEWCQGRGENYRQGEMLDDINKSESIKEIDPRLLRGGSFDYLPAIVRSAFRIWNRPSNRCHLLRFPPRQDLPLIYFISLPLPPFYFKMNTKGYFVFPEKPTRRSRVGPKIANTTANLAVYRVLNHGLNPGFGHGDHGRRGNIVLKFNCSNELYHRT